MAGASREAVNDFVFLRGRQNETFVKELCVASATAGETFQFKSPYMMADHGSSEKGINWADGHIEYKVLRTVSTEAVAGFVHFFAHGVSKVTFLSTLMGRPIHNREDVGYLTPNAFNRKHRCTVPCHKFRKYACATKTAHSLYDWLMHYLQTKDYVRCPCDMTLHYATFIAAL